MREIYVIFICICCSNTATTFGQVFQEIRNKYPDEDIVVLKNFVHYTFRIENDKPTVKSSETEEWIYLTENAAVMLKEGKMYHSGFHELGKYEAYTITQNGKKVKVQDFKTTANKSNSIFYDDSKVTAFSFPALAPGAVSHLEYETNHKEPHLLGPHYFSRGVPTVSNELRISFPKNIRIKYVLRGLESGKIRFTEESRRTETTYIFTAKDLAAEQPYPDAPSNAYWATHVVFYIEKYQHQTGEWVNFLSSTDDLYRLNYSFIKAINRDTGNELKQIVDSLTKGVSGDEEKARRIYSWVQNNIKYVAFEEGMEGFIPRDANLVCSRRFGDCKDMSSILTVMLRHAGLKAYYTWIGTRSLPYTYTEIPTPIVDNHMICTVRLNEEFIFLDGTDATCVFGIPSEHIQNKEALVSFDEKSYKILQVPCVDKSKNLMVDSTVLELTDKGLKGRINIDMKGYYAMNMRSSLAYINQKESEKFFKQMLSRGSNKFSLTGYDVDKKKDNKNEISLKAYFELPDYGKKLAENWFINMNLIKHYEHEEIDYPKRRIPVEFDFKSIRRYVTVLQLPENYKVEFLPQSKTYKNDTWGFSMQYEQEKNRVVLVQEFENDHLLLAPEKFQEWNKVLENLFPLYKETISLTRK